MGLGNADLCSIFHVPDLCVHALLGYLTKVFCGAIYIFCDDGSRELMPSGGEFRACDHSTAISCRHEVCRDMSTLACTAGLMFVSLLCEASQGSAWELSAGEVAAHMTIRCKHVCGCPE